VAAGGFDRAAYNELAELGLAGLYVSEADGGMGMGPVEGMVVMEELGRGIVLEPLAQTLIAGGVLSPATRTPPSRPPGCRKSPRAKPWWCWPPGAQGALPARCLRGKSHPVQRRMVIERQKHRPNR
jgi:alkylation response protein AidB-like acyl-CoA dehydrogenase